MKLPNDLIKDLQLARVYRAIGVLLELAVIYASVYGIYAVISTVISWF